MNKIEFDEIMKVCGINKTYENINDDNITIEEIYSWNNLDIIRFKNKDLIEVNGKIPLSLARELYQKTLTSNYQDYSGIRVSEKNNNPDNCAVDDKYEEEIKEYTFERLNNTIDERTCLLKQKEALKRLKRRKDTNKYIKQYEIINDRKSLLIFLTYIRDYYIKNNIPYEGINKSNYESLDNQVITNLLETMDPSLSIYDWIEDSFSKDMFNETIKRDNSTALGRIFREALNNFDESVNPFINDKYDINDTPKYKDKLKLNPEISNNGECFLSFKDKNLKNSKTSYIVSNEKINFYLSYASDDKYIAISHKLTSYILKEKNSCEVLEIYVPKENIDIRLDITNGRIGSLYGKKTPVTIEQLAIIYDKLLEATNYAKSITIDNMSKKEYKELNLTKKN